MENRKAIIISAICFLISILLIAGYVRALETEMTKDFGEKVPVVIVSTKSNRMVNEYETITAGMLEIAEVFKKFRQPAAVEDPADVIGRAAYVPMYPGEQITLTNLVSQDHKPVLDRQVEREKRALTLSIAAHTGVGRLIRPGDRVDILTAPHYDMNGTVIFEVATVLSNVLVLATGKYIQNEVPARFDQKVMTYLQESFEKEKRKDWGSGNREERLITSRPTDNYNTVTIQVSPEEAKKLLYLVATYGPSRLYFTLRNPADQEVAKIQTTLLDDVLGPDSDYGRTFRKPPSIPPAKPKFYDLKGDQPVPIWQ